MDKIKNSQWRLSAYALLACFGAMIGGLLVNQSIYVVWGFLTSLAVLVLINVFYVIYKNNKGVRQKSWSNIFLGHFLQYRSSSFSSFRTISAHRL